MLNEELKINMDKFVDEALLSEPEFMLSEKFAEKIAARVERNFEWNQYLKEFLIYLVAISGIVITSGIIAFVWFRADLNNWTAFLLENVSWVIGLNLLVIFILFADKVLLRYFLFKSTTNIKANFS